MVNHIFSFTLANGLTEGGLIIWRINGVLTKDFHLIISEIYHLNKKLKCVFIWHLLKKKFKFKFFYLEQLFLLLLFIYLIFSKVEKKIY